MSDFIVSEAEESEDEEELTEAERKRLKKLKEKQRSDSDEEDDDDDDGREDLKDLIDDNPIEDEDSASSESDAESSDGGKRKRDDDDELDDRLSEEDYELLEENLGVKMKRKKQFKRLKRIEDDESEDEGSRRVPGVERDAIANELFEGSDAEEDRRHSREKASDRGREEPDKYSEEEEEEDEEDIGDFIVDAEGRPIHEKRKKRKAIYTDAALQQAQDIFGVDFDYEDVEQEPEDYEDEEEEEEYEGEDGERVRKKVDRRGPKKKTQRKTIYELYEPSELERGHFTDFDNQIRNTDIPERMQLRHIPVTPAEEGGEELVEEAEWIYKHAFLKPYISIQEGDSDGRDKPRKGSSAIAKIRKALEFMRNLHLEVPFIAFYRKEYVQPELNINDLWRVYRFDEKWCQLQNRKRNMLRLFERMQKYQTEKLTQNIEDALPDSVRLLKNEDVERLRCVQSLEELNDVYAHFMLYYGNDVSDMQEAYKKKQQEETRERRKNAQRNADGEEMEEADVNPPENEEFGSQTQPEQEATVKQAKRNDQYTLCVKAGLDGLIKKFGLSPEQFAENLRDNYQRHEVEQYPADSLEAAQEYLGTKFSSCNEVLNAAVFMLATQIAKEPQVRQCVREAFYERAKITVVPTKQGLKEIDESHPLYPMKFLKDKPVRDLMSDQFLRIVMGEQDKLLTLTFETGIEGLTSPSYVDEAKQLFHRDEFSRQVQDWNDLRSRVIDMALNKIIFPALTKELKARLLSESREAVVKSCCYKLYNWLKVAPYKVDFAEEEEDEWDTRNGLRVMALSYVPDLEQAAFASLVNMDGECTDHLRLEHILKRKNAWKEADRAAKEKDLSRIRNFIFTKKPHVIAVSGESREALMLVEDLKGVVATLVQDEQFPMINVELMDNSLAKVFSNSTKAESEFREYPHLLRESISIARRLQDPLIEFSQLCNSDEEILCLKYHSLQDQIPKEELQEALYLEFINRVNEVGVDINRALNFPYTANLVQFICGLGPRKGQALLKILKQSNQRLENRTQLVTACHMGPKVFINCAGFIKIDTNSLGDSTDSYVEVLDGSRVHPETYEWARKMAVDALEYDDEDANPAGAVEEILEAPERLKDLDLDAFADELERQGFGNKSITLYDIRAELNHRYKDLRASYQSPSPEEVFNMVTKETPETFYIGKMVMATVTGFTHRKPQREQLDRANPVRNEETGLWQCPFCFKNDFTDLSEVWNHFDAGACPGQATGVLVRLENGLNGFIPIKFLSDREVSNPEERVRPGQNIHCRVMKIDVERFSVSCTSKSSDLLDKNGEWRPPKDPFYDASAEERLLEQDQKSKKQKNQLSYTRRVIVHPSFKNVSYRDAEKMMTNMDQGEVIIRPSSKGTDHLTVTWKVAPEIYQHVDVREEGKENVFSLGKSLWIGDEEYEDLDEIIARFVNPMAAHARDILCFRYFRDLGLSGQPVVPGKEREKAEETIKEDKKKNPSKIHYFVSASRELPGKFMLSYLPRSHAKHEYITVTPEGFRFRGQIFESLTSLFRWFKEHFREPPPGTPRAGGGGGASRTPGFAGSATPNVNLAGVNAETLQRVAQSIPSHMLHSLSQAAHFQGTPGPYGYSASTPYTPSGQTPFMTPYAATPHQPQTPKYTTTPSAGSSTPGPSSFPAATPTPGSSAVFRTPASSSASRGGGSFATPTAPSPYSSRRQPGTPASGSSGGFSQSSTPGRPAPGQSRSAQSSEPVDWRRAAEAWAQSRQKPSHSASSSGRADDGKGQSRSSTGATPRHDDKDRSSRPAPSSSSRGGGSNTPGRNPRTPKSPRSMDVGDATPLYDE